MCDELFFNQITTKRNDVIKMTTKQMIEFENVDEIVELISNRFENARMIVNDEMRNSIRDDFDERETLTFDFDEFHELIEQNLRNSIAMNIAMIIMRDDNNEFRNVFAIVDEQTFHVFNIVEIDDDTKRISQIIMRIHIDDKLNVRTINNLS
jgi:hypothetical protein